MSAKTRATVSDAKLVVQLLELKKLLKYFKIICRLFLSWWILNSNFSNLAKISTFFSVLKINLIQYTVKSGGTVETIGIIKGHLYHDEFTELVNSGVSNIILLDSGIYTSKDDCRRVIFGDSLKKLCMIHSGFGNFEDLSELTTELEKAYYSSALCFLLVTGQHRMMDDMMDDDEDMREDEVDEKETKQAQPKSDKNQHQNSETREKISPKERLYWKSIRCAFNCAAKSDMRPIMEIVPQCQTDLKCYQEPFNELLKTIEPCFNQCMSVSEKNQ
eukprot:gene4106-7392_t